MTDVSLEDLMEQYVAGSASAFDELYHRTAPQLFGFLVRLSQNRNKAEDLLQVTYAKVHRARSSYFQGAPVLPWMLAIARRSFYDERRAAHSRHEQLTKSGSVPESEPPDASRAADVAEAVERALDEMPINYREAIQLTKVTGLTIKEAAEVLDTSPIAVKLRVHRGFVLLRKQLQALYRGAA
ncbi:MAG: RNA polymerase sigma factor [Polyangiaceae bacterium]|nr:RNA polymerase sigma factor [Polyangiaceae bacterium]